MILNAAFQGNAEFHVLGVVVIHADTSFLIAYCC